LHIAYFSRVADDIQKVQSIWSKFIHYAIHPLGYPMPIFSVGIYFSVSYFSLCWFSIFRRTRIFCAYVHFNN